MRDFLSTPTVRIKLVALDTPKFNANMTLTRAFVAQIKGLRRASHAESNFQALWNLVFDALHHISRVGDGVSPEAQVALLDELDRAAAHFRDVAIVKRRCGPTAHWVNTGYRLGLDPKWNNNLLTLCIQYNLIPYVRQKLFHGVPLGRSGRPLLAFAMTSPSSNTSTNSYNKEKISYDAPQLKMVKLLLDRGADPNEIDGSGSIWARYLVSLYTLATISESQFYKQTKNWFEVTKLLLTHGASPQITCSITVQPSKLADRVNLSEENSKVTSMYSALEIIRLIFGGDSGYDVIELEDLLEQQQQHASSHSRSISHSYLQVPWQGLEQGNAGRPRSPPGSSQNSQASAASWRRQTERDVVVPLQYSSIRETKQIAGPVVESVPLTSQKQKKYSGLLNWFHRKEKPPHTRPYVGT